MTRATPAEMRWLGVTVARAGFAPTGSAGEPAGRVGMRSARLLPASNSSAKTAVARRSRGSVVRAASAAAWAIAEGAPYGRHCIRRDQELVCIGELRLPNPAATLTTKLAGPAAGQPQACHFDTIGGSAVWTDDQHWRIGKRKKRTPRTLTAVC